MGDFDPFRNENFFNYVVLNKNQRPRAFLSAVKTTELKESWDHLEHRDLSKSVDPSETFPAESWNRRLVPSRVEYYVTAHLPGQEFEEPGKNLPPDVASLVEHLNKNKGVNINGHITGFEHKDFIKTLEDFALSQFRIEMISGA